MTRWRQVFVFAIALTNSLPVLVVGDLPVTLVIILGTVNIILEFFIYPANLRVVLDHVPKAFRPSSATVVVHIVMIVVLLCFAILGAAESVSLLG
jgi:hypothetical protein